MGNRVLYLARHGEADVNGELTERGRDQARLLGSRLREVGLTAIHHSPLSRAVETAGLISEQLPEVPVTETDLIGDYLPSGRCTDGPARFVPLFDEFSPDELADGERRAAAAVARFTGPTETDSYELIVTHNFMIGWLVRHAMDAPDWRWMGLNHTNCGLSVIRYNAERPASLLVFNDQSHLPPELQWTGYPSALRP